MTNILKEANRMILFFKMRSWELKACSPQHSVGRHLSLPPTPNPFQFRLPLSSYPSLFESSLYATLFLQKTCRSTFPLIKKKKKSEDFHFCENSIVCVFCREPLQQQPAPWVVWGAPPSPLLGTAFGIRRQAAGPVTCTCEHRALPPFMLCIPLARCVLKQSLLLIIPFLA